MAGRPIRVLIVDDSALIRSVLRASLVQHPHIEVVGQAVDGLDALARIDALRPDVVTLDVEMPRLNGIGVLERIASRADLSALMVSTLTQAGARVTMEALQKGAFDYIAKPQRGFAGSPEFRKTLHDKVVAAAHGKGRRRALGAAGGPSAAPSLPPSKQRGWIVAIGISCGGPQTLTRIMPSFPSDFPPILITQHMPAEFTRSFAKHLDDACSMSVKEAEHGEKVEAGRVYVAPGGRHMRLKRRGVDLRIELDDGAAVSGHRPSVDVLFDSVAEACGPRAIGVIMTGMGADGAAGLAKMRLTGAWTIAQDEETSLVFGMPKEAIKGSAADHVVGLNNIPFGIARLMQRGCKITPSTPEVSRIPAESR